jgi:hypothetical protein
MVSNDHMVIAGTAFFVWFTMHAEPTIDAPRGG